jgi:hypothetical protein
MRVRMRTTYAGPGGTARAGATIDVDDEEAAMLIDRGYAEAIDGDASGTEAENANTEAGAAAGDGASGDENATSAEQAAAETATTRNRKRPARKPKSAPKE